MRLIIGINVLCALCLWVWDFRLVWSFEVAFLGTMGVIVSSYKAIKSKIQAETSPLGMQCGEIADFVECTDTKSANIPQNPQSSHSHTASAGSLESHSSCSKFCENPTLHSLQRTKSPLHSPKGSQPINLIQDARILNSKNENLESNENLGLSLRESEANEAIHTKINSCEARKPLSIVGGLGVQKGDKGSDFAFVRSTNPHLQIQAPFPSLKIKSIENPCEKDSNQSGNLESRQNLNLSLRESVANEAIHKNTESNPNNKTLNKIYNFLFLHNLNERRSLKKCNKFHSLGLQGIVGKWRSPLKPKGDFKGGTLPSLHKIIATKLRIIGRATHQNEINGSNEVAAQFKKSENEVKQKIEVSGLPRSLATSCNDKQITDSKQTKILDSATQNKTPQDSIMQDENPQNFTTQNTQIPQIFTTQNTQNPQDSTIQNTQNTQDENLQDSATDTTNSTSTTDSTSDFTKKQRFMLGTSLSFSKFRLLSYGFLAFGAIILIEARLFSAAAFFGGITLSYMCIIIFALRLSHKNAA